jgi:hypothetical protein
MSKFSLPARQGGKAQAMATPQVDPAALDAFAAGAKEQAPAEGPARPWAGFDPKEPAKYNVSVRLNDHHLEMLRYLAGSQDTSQQRVMRKILIPLIESLAEEAFLNESS